MDLDEVKVCLRALLSSNPMSYHVNSLLNDFKNITGLYLPLFGYLTPVEFLKSLDDTVKLKGDPYNPEIVLVGSEKSAHIISLVDRQKVNDKSGHRNPYLTGSHRRHVVPGRTNVQYHSSNGSYLSLQDHSNIYAQESQPLVQIRETNIYAWTPPQPKIITADTAVKSQKVDPVTLNTSFDRETAIVPAQDKSLLEKAVFKYDAKIRTDSQIDTDQCYFEDIEICEKNNSSSDSSSGSINSSLKNKLEKFIKNYPEGLWCCELPELFFEEYNFALDYREYGEINQIKWVVHVKKLLCGKCEEFVTIIKCKKCKSHEYKSTGTLLSELKGENDLKCAAVAILTALGFSRYTSLIQMLSELPDVFRVVRPGNGDWIVFDASVAPSEKEKKIVDSQSKGETMNGVKANIQKLLSKFNDKSSSEGVELDKMAELYQKMFGTSLDVSSLGFKDLRSLLEIWEGSILNLVNVRGKLVCSPAISGKVHSPVRWEEALPPITAENDIFAEIFPKEVSGPDETFAVLDLSRHIAVGHEVEVCVAEVWSPSKFFVQLNKYKTRLNQFMDELQKFYNVHLTKYKMPDSTLRPNQICVALYNSDPEYPDEWHRAQIMKVINEKTVLINFVDYGTVTRVKKSHLRFLHRRFRAFPVQAIQAQLSGVAPPNEEEMWPMTTSKKFLELLRVPYLKAEMMDIDFKKPALSVVLHDPFSKTKLSINKRLVQDKLARSREPLYFEEVIPKTKSPKDETKRLSENSSGALAQANENFTKHVTEITDQFLDVDDLNYSPLLQFKMRMTTAPPISEEKKEETKKTEPVSNVSFEFEEIPELQEASKKKEGGGEEKKAETRKQSLQVDAKAKEVLHEPPPSPPEREKPNSPASPDPEVPQERSKPDTPQTDAIPVDQIPQTKPKRLPPGLEHVNTQIPLFLQTNDHKKKVNILAMELLTTNDSIKQVGVNDPALALRIATEMAEAYLSSQVSLNLPMCCNLFPLLSPSFAPALPEISPEDSTRKELVLTLSPEASSCPPGPPTSSGDYDSTQNQAHGSGSECKIPGEDESVDRGKGAIAAVNASSKENSPCHSSSESNLNTVTESNEYIEEMQIGGKTLHLVRVDNEFYLSSEELVRQFTLFSNREIADRLLHTKKIKPDYRVLSKKSDSTVIQALKSYLPGIVKRKTKKLKIYLLPVSKAVPFLQALGCITKTFESGFLELQKNREGKQV